MSRFDADSEISLVTPRVGSQNISTFQPGAPTQPVSPASSRSVWFKNFNNSVNKVRKMCPFHIKFV